MCTNSTLCKLILKFQVLDFWEAKSIRSFEMSQEKFRVPLPGRIGPGMSATIPNFMPPKSKKFSDEEMSEISQRLMKYLNEETPTIQVTEKKKSKEELADDRRLLSALYPDKSSSKKR